MPRLEVEITGEIRDLEKALKKAEQDLKDLEGQSLKTGAKIQRTGTQAASGINKLGGATANAVPAVTEFSRIIQDLPFGIRGVANNVTAALERFQQLSARLGGSTKALKAMASSLIGPAGILFAVSTVTSLLVSFGDKLFSSSKKSDKLADSTKKTNEELQNQSQILKDLIKDYEQFSKIRTQSIFNTTKEKENVKALFAVLRSELSTTEERQRAYSALNKTYSEYLKNVDPNNINQVIKAEIKLSKQLEVREKRIQTLNKLEETAREIQLKRLELDNLGNVAVNDKRQAALGTEILQLRQLQKELREALELYTSLDTSIGELGQGQRPQATTLETGLVATGLSEIGNQLDVILQRPLTQIDDFTQKMQLALLAFNERMRQIIQNNIANTFAGIGEAIGNALTGAQNLGDGLAKVLLSSVGSILKQLGTLAITIGVTLLKVKTALSTLRPEVAIAAGIAAIGLGTAFSAGASNLGSQIQGGNVSSGVGGATSGNFGTGRTGFSGQSLFGNLTFTIRGEDLVAVVNNAIDQTAIFGGNVTVGND